jgi:acetyltransferase
MNAVHVPTRLIDVVGLPDGRRVTLRPVLPQDAELQQQLVRSLSPASRMRRFFAPIRELPPQWLQRLTMVDHRDHVALIAETFVGRDAVAVGEARYVVDVGDVGGVGGVADFALVVADAWQGHGIGRRLLASLLEHARDAGVRRLVGEVQHDNTAMLALARALGLSVQAHAGDARLLQVVATLQAPTHAPTHAPAQAPAPWRAHATAKAPSAPPASAAA